jgi:hypothetical protein
MKTKLSTMLFLLATFLPFSTTAGSFNCAGKLNYLGMSASGGILIGIENVASVHAICNTVTQGSFQVLPSVCKSMYATLLAARIAQTQVRTYYYNDPLISSCSQIAAWSVLPSFGFVELANW